MFIFYQRYSHHGLTDSNFKSNPDQKSEYLTKLDHSVYFLNCTLFPQFPQSPSGIWGLNLGNAIATANYGILHSIPQPQSLDIGRSSGRATHPPIIQQGLSDWFRAFLRSPLTNQQSSFSGFSSDSEGLPCCWQLFSLKRNYSGLLPPWVPVVLGWLIVPLNSCKSCLKILKHCYLQYTSKSINIGDIKSFPPKVKVWKPRLKGDRFKATLGLPTSQVMSKLTLFEKYRQAGLLGLFRKLAIATLTLAIKGGAR